MKGCVAREVGQASYLFSVSAASSAGFPACGSAELSSSAMFSAVRNWGLESPQNRQAGRPALRCRTFCDKEARDRRHKGLILEHAVAEGVIKSLTVRDLISTWIQGTYRNAPFGIEILVARC